MICLPVSSLHGTKLGDEGLEMLLPTLHAHPKLQSLDLGDCRLGDEGVRQLCTLLPPSEDKAHLTELTLSANGKVTPHGWAHLAIAMAAASCLRCLYLDYNTVGDFGATAFAVALTSCKSLERVDLEGSGITEFGATLLFDVVANYPTKLQELVLSENDISKDLLGQINDCLVKVVVENGGQDAEPDTSAEVGQACPWGISNGDGVLVHQVTKGLEAWFHVDQHVHIIELQCFFDIPEAPTQWAGTQ